MEELRENCGLFGIVKKHTGVLSSNIAKMAFVGLFQLTHRGQEAAGISVDDGTGCIKTVKGEGTIDWVFRKQVRDRDLANFILANPTRWQLKRYICEECNLSYEACEELYSSMSKEDVMEEAISIFKEENAANPLDLMDGELAMGHVRYSTTGASGRKNAQPLGFEFHGKQGAIGLNGNVDTVKPEAILKERGGYSRFDTTDTGLIAGLLATSKAPTFFEALIETVRILEGAFSLLILYDGKIYAAKDRFSIRPLCWGETDDHYFVASESTALDNFRARFLGEIEPGTILIIDPSNKENPTVNYQWASFSKLRMCLFEKFYFSAPQSLLWGTQRAALVRESLGREAAKEHPLEDVDIVAPVLDSGLFGAVGYSEGLEENYSRKIEVLEFGKILPPHLFGYAFVKGRVGRTFLEPVADDRVLLQNLKHQAIPEKIEGRHLVVVDDTLVRGTAMPEIIKKLRFFKAKRVSVIILAPPVRSICHLGVDIPYYNELAAYDKSIEEVRILIGADYLGYLSLESVYRALGEARENHCDGCLTGEYPVPLPDKFKYRPKEK